MAQKVNRAYFVLPGKLLQTRANHGDDAAKEELERREKRKKRKKKKKKL